MVRSYPKPHLENASRRFSALSSDFYDQGGMAERHHSISFVYRNDAASTTWPFKDFTPCRSVPRTPDLPFILSSRRRSTVVPRSTVTVYPPSAIALSSSFPTVPHSPSFLSFFLLLLSSF